MARDQLGPSYPGASGINRGSTKVTAMAIAMKSGTDSLNCFRPCDDPLCLRRNLLVFVVLLCSTLAKADNPIVKNIFTADPSARVFGDRLYIYCSHDQPDATYWDMVDWRLISRADMATWKDHGNIFSLKGLVTIYLTTQRSQAVIDFDGKR
ncbi:MAG: hypothetical protein ABSB74_19300 [Tepidisphaeraceae bacterium]